MKEGEGWAEIVVDSGGVSKIEKGRQTCPLKP
jgi:hypothetical protein